MTQPDWPVRFVRVVADEIRRYRQALVMSTQQLADATAAAGQAIPRSVIANLESGRREAVTIPELVALARALRVHPVELVFPLGHSETIEILPDQHVPTWSAVKWFTGEGPFPDLPIPDLTGPRNPAGGVALELHREYERHLTEWNRRKQQATSASVSPGPDETPDHAKLREQIIVEADRAARAEEDVLDEIRRRMRQRGFTPPPIYDPRLRYLDGGEE